MSDKKSILSFQKQVADLLIRHRSFLDASSKLGEANSRVNRAVMKAVTECGCIQVQATKQPYSSEESLEEWRERAKTHLSGELCDHCADVVREEMGKSIFYLTGLCNLLNISMEEVIEQEQRKLTTLGVFNLR